MTYRRMTGIAVPAMLPIANPYFLKSAPIRDAHRFTHQRTTCFWCPGWTDSPSRM